MFHAEKHNFLKHKTLALLALVFLLSFMTKRDHSCCDSPFVTTAMAPDTNQSIAKMTFDGNLSFENIEYAAKDFGNRCCYSPWAVLHPKSVSDISSVIKYIYGLGLTSEFTVAARGHGHSLNGQAQAHQGIVISMESLRMPVMNFRTGKQPYVDVSAGELWINVLHESLKRGLAPKSWTDYLHLTVGGTLSNAGISGQAFRHGPQINNVDQLQVVTGKGDVATCSEEHNSDLFHAVLGGLGQFGVITQARITLEPAPKMVKWIRALYTDFSTFAYDQEHIISSTNSFDYVEGLVIINRTGLLNNWRSSFNPKDPVRANQFTSEGKILDFLDRVHVSEIKLRENGLWDVPHPWLNLLIPRSKINEFARGVFGNIVKDTSNGPVLITARKTSGKHISAVAGRFSRGENRLTTPWQS